MGFYCLSLSPANKAKTPVPGQIQATLTPRVVLASKLLAPVCDADRNLVSGKCLIKTSVNHSDMISQHLSLRKYYFTITEQTVEENSRPGFMALLKMMKSREDSSKNTTDCPIKRNLRRFLKLPEPEINQTNEPFSSDSSDSSAVVSL